MSNILIIKHGSLGDIAQACGAIQDISENHKNDQIYLLTTKPYFDLFKKNPFIQAFEHTFDLRPCRSRRPSCSASGTCPPFSSRRRPEGLGLDTQQKPAVGELIPQW